MHNLALLRAHRIERYRPFVPNRSLGGLVGDGVQRVGSSLAIAGRVYGERLALVNAVVGDAICEVLDRVDGLAVVTDQEREVIAHELGDQAVSRVLDAHLGVDSGRLRVPISAVFPMAEVTAAYDYFTAGGKLGKVVLVA